MKTNSEKTVEVGATTEEGHETVLSFTFSQETLARLKCKDWDELLEKIQLQQVDPFKWADDMRWMSYGSAVTTYDLEDATFVSD